MLDSSPFAGRSLDFDRDEIHSNSKCVFLLVLFRFKYLIPFLSRLYFRFKQFHSFQQNQQLLSSKLDHRPKYSKDETKFDSDNESSNQENGNTEREIESGSGDGTGKTMTGQGRNSDRHRTEARLEMMQKELLILRNECEVLKDANERLVRE